MSEYGIRSKDIYEIINEEAERAKGGRSSPAASSRINSLQTVGEIVGSTATLFDSINKLNRPQYQDTDIPGRI